VRGATRCYSFFLQGEDGGLPGSHVQKQAARLQIIALSFIGGIAELILQPPLGIPEVRERQPDVALTLIGGIVYRDQKLPRAYPNNGDRTFELEVLSPLFGYARWFWHIKKTAAVGNMVIKGSLR